MKVYISLPMRGQETTVRDRYEEAVKIIHNKYPEAIISGAQNINQFDENGYNGDDSINGREKPWEWYIGEDVKELLTCNSIFLCDGWENSDGCCVEYAVAVARKMLIMYKKWL